MEKYMDATTETPINPLLDRVKIPGETIRLPSNGIFYTSGELSPEVTNGEVHIYPLTTMSEILLRSPDKILSGDALTDVIAQCAPQIVKPMSILSKDVDYLLTALRKVTYGDTLDVAYTHNCKDAVENTYSVSLTTILAASKTIDPTTLNKTFSLSMDNGQTVKLQPMKFRNVVEIMQSVQNYTTDDKEIGRQLMKSISYMIQAVDEITNPDQIMEWLQTIPSTWFNKISKSIEEVSQWGPDFEYKTACKDCGQEVELSVTLNPLTFFM
jgi:hypothetical protein